MQTDLIHDKRCYPALNATFKQANTQTVLVVCVTNRSLGLDHIPISGYVEIDMEMKNGKVLRSKITNRAPILCSPDAFRQSYEILYIEAGLTGHCVRVGIILKGHEYDLYLDIPLTPESNPCKQAIVERCRDYDVQRRLMVTTFNLNHWLRG
jgi:hypothetical protein